MLRAERCALYLVLPLLLLLAAPGWAATVTTADTGQVQFVSGTELFSSAQSGAFGPAWEWTSQASATDLADVTLTPTTRVLTGSFAIGGTAASVAFQETAARVDTDSLHLRYDFTVTSATQFNSLWVSFSLPCRGYAGKTVTAYDAGGAVLQSLPLPDALGAAQLFWRDGVSRLEVASGDAIGYTVRFATPGAVLLQDNRYWSGTDFELRLECLGAYSGQPVPAGTQFACDLQVDFPSAVDFQLDPSVAVSQTDTTGWVPFVMPWDGAPVDLSWLNATPAGSHGFVTVQDGHFAFEDGTPARFWGTCNSAAANFPTHAQSEAIAARMAKFGVNIVRTHHADAYWSDPNFFDESYGDTQHFDADALDRFDYFVSQLKQHGIYVYLDQLVHRMFTTGDGVVNADQLPAAGKPYTLFDPTLIALQQQFSHDLWTHVNPYTGLAYKDDPAIAIMDFTNENDIYTADVTVEPYATNFEQLWQDWATAHAVDPDQPVRLVSERSSDVLRFIDDLQKQYYAEMHAYLRGLGVKVPMTGNTWLVTGANLPSQSTMDYQDGHSYWDHPTGNYDHFTNRRMVEADATQETTNLSMLSVSRVLGKPFVASEWGHPWPNEYRAEGSLPIAAVGAFQDWDGALVYSYRHTTATPVDTLSGPFETFNDPAVFGLFPAAALIFRRGDVAPGPTVTAVQWSDAQLFSSPSLWTWSAPDAYRPLAETTRLATALATPTGVVETLTPADQPGSSGPTSVDSDDGQLHRDWSQGVGTIDTARTQAAYGLVGAAGTIDLSDASFTLTTPFAAVALSSLDGADLSASHRLLLTAVGRAENTGLRYNLTHTQLMASGATPILVEPILGQMALRSTPRDYWIYALGPDGARRLLSIQHLAAGDPLTIDLTAEAATIYYQLVASRRFRDVPVDFWSEPEIEACAAAGIVAGYDDNTYRPALAVTRDQMAVYVARALAGGDVSVTAPAGPAPFSDVPTDYWAYRHVAYAVEHGVVQGYDDGTYRPTVEVDRGQMAVFISRGLAGSDAAVATPTGAATFADVPADFWSYRHIEYLADPLRSIVRGYDDGNYHPEYVVTRDQMAVYVARAFGGAW